MSASDRPAAPAGGDPTTCRHCGQPIEAGDVFCSGCGARVSPTERICSVCRAPNRVNTHFCTACGASLDDATPSDPPPPAGTAPPLPPPVAEPTPAAAGFALSTPVSLLGAVVAFVGSLLPWFDAFGTTTNSFDVPVQYLVDHTTTASDTLTVGAVVALLAAAAVIACLVPRSAQRGSVLRGLGAILVAVAASFAYQLFRTADSVGVSLGDVVGIGPIVTAVGAVAVISAR